MAVAQILVNGVAGSQKVPINKIVQLTNQTIEITYLWTILDQPEGPADSLSANNIPNPTFTPLKEGTYLLQLIVNQGLGALEQQNQVVVEIVLLKTGERPPAAGETVEDDAQRGWATAVNRLLKRIDSLAADAGIAVGQAQQAGLQRLMVLHPTSAPTIKTGLPGQEKVPGFVLAQASSATSMEHSLSLLEQGVDGSNAPASGALIRARLHGAVYGITGTGAEVVGDPVYVSDAGLLSWMVPGTYIRQVGFVIQQNGGTYDLWFDGHGLVRTGVDHELFGNGTTSNAGGAVFYLTPGYQTAGAIIAPAQPPDRELEGGGRVVRFKVRGSAPVGDSVQYTLYLNGAPTAMTCTVPAGALEAADENEAHSFSFSKTDRLRLVGVNGAGVTAGMILVVADVVVVPA